MLLLSLIMASVRLSSSSSCLRCLYYQYYYIYQILPGSQSIALRLSKFGMVKQTLEMPVEQLQKPSLFAQALELGDTLFKLTGARGSRKQQQEQGTHVCLIWSA